MVVEFNVCLYIVPTCMSVPFRSLYFNGSPIRKNVLRLVNFRQFVTVAWITTSYWPYLDSVTHCEIQILRCLCGITMRMFIILNLRLLICFSYVCSVLQRCRRDAVCFSVSRKAFYFGCFAPLGKCPKEEIN